MSTTVHPICAQCYADREPGRVPVRITFGVKKEVCCFCGRETEDGTYYRDDQMKCTHA